MSQLPSNFPQPQSGIFEINPYVPGAHKAPQADKLYKLSSNESGIGASPKAIDAYRSVAENLEIYPDGYGDSLRQALAKHHGIHVNNIIFGAGSDEILSMIAMAYLQPGDEAIYSEHGFLMYPIVTRSAGATPVVAKEKNFTLDVDAMLGCVTSKTKVMFLANPNNPTGTYLPFSEIQRLHNALPSSVLLVLDAAYAEFVRRNDYQVGIELAGSTENVIMTRTFSKLYGLAGLRLGWGYGSATIIDYLNRVRSPHNLNCGALAAGEAALQDLSFFDRALAHNDKWLPVCTESLQNIGLDVTPSVCNFLLVHFPQKNGKTAQDAYEFMLQRGVILRQMGGYGLPHSLRITIGSDEANEAMINGLTAFMAL